jgi:hypothetical protein
VTNPEVGESYLWEFVQGRLPLPEIKDSKITRVLQR